MADEINKNSAEFILGQILQRLENGDKAFTGFTEALSTLRVAVSQMPCIIHTQQIASIQQWQCDCKDDESVKKQAKVELKTVIVGGIAVALGSSGLTYLVAKLFGG